MSLFEPTPSATYKNNVERDPPKPKPWPKSMQPRKSKVVSRPNRQGEDK